MPADQPTAFFSYSREDLEFALRLAKDLKKAGANVWMDKLDIHPGQPWQRKIDEALTKAQVDQAEPFVMQGAQLIYAAAFSLHAAHEVLKNDSQA